MSKRTLLRPLALASLIANIGLVVTGAAVRLTSSGLGCPTWPRCTDASYTTTAEMGVRGVIEFGNRLLGIALGLIALACFIAALLERPRRRSLVLLSLAVGLGIPGQGVIGGITVLTDLNPWVVGLHFLLSMTLIALAYALWKRTAEGDGPPRRLVPAPLVALARLTALASAAVIVVGVIVTGSGPHAGDEKAKRNGLDPELISQVHADLVFLLIGLSVALWFALRAVRAPGPAVRAAGILVLIELGQGLIGFVQYFTHLPVLLVGAHILGACLVWLGTLSVLWSLRERPAATPAPPAAPIAETAEPVAAPVA
ncbi:COX15/CtaA family protein, partial [Actinoplanes sp. NPDC049118]|uniref:COX15/CtaA family protein n=1 Tax=Actinoplanes sp. NPDC049118 TaxID=3155769 RepID=UPI0033EB9B46